MSKFLNASVHFLNPYTIMQAQNSISQLYEEIENRHKALAPRKRFAFSKKQTRKQQVTTSLTVPEDFQVHLEGIKDSKSQTFFKSDQELRDLNCYQLKNLEDCEVVLTGRLKAIHILSLRNCRVYCGPVAGAAHITDCFNCVINVASHQLRIHESTQCQFYVHASTNPIVEKVSEVGFAPYAFEYPDIKDHFRDCGLESPNTWNQVQDFKWLKKEPSPNWYVIQETSRLPLKSLHSN